MFTTTTTKPPGIMVESIIMNKNCISCKKEYRIPDQICGMDLPEDFKSGMTSAGDTTLVGSNIPVKYFWGVHSPAGDLCPECCYKVISAVIKLHVKDVEGLLAGRNYGEHRIED